MKIRFRTSTLFLTLLIVVFALTTLMFINARQTAITQQASLQAPTSEGYPPPPEPTPSLRYLVDPPPTRAVSRTPPPSPTPYWTPTRRPWPTHPPTPVVTVFPTAEPPIVPPQPGEAVSYRLVFNENNNKILRIVEESGEETIVDVHALTGKWLAGMGDWGKPSPSGRYVVLSLWDEIPFETDALFLGVGDLYLLDTETAQLRLLVEEGSYPAWSSNGSRIAYRNNRTGALDILDVSSGDTQEFYRPSAKNIAVSTPLWSPDDRKIAFAWSSGGMGLGAIMVIDLDSRATVQVVPGKFFTFPHQWPVSGDEVFFISVRGEDLSSRSPRNLWKVNIHTRVRQQVTQDLSILSKVGKSPNGEWLVFSGVHKLEGSNIAHNLWLFRIDNNNLKRLTNGLPNRLFRFWISNRKIFYERRRGNDPGLWQIDLFTGKRQKLADKGRDFVAVKK